MKKKFLIVVMAMCLLAAFMIGGTLAWLTSTPASITNTFTFGKVAITLTETNVDGGSETANSYKLVPGQTLEKDPTVNVIEGSEASWLFVKVVETDAANAISFLMADGWTALTGVNNVYFRQQAAVADDGDGDANEALVNIPVLKNNQVTVSDSLTSAQLASATATIAITAYAVQEGADVGANTEGLDPETQAAEIALAKALAAWNAASFS